MQRLLDDEDAVIFDLNEIFGESKVEMEEISSDDIPDEVLTKILEQSENLTSEFRDPLVDLPANVNNAQETPTKSRFKTVCTEDVDKIASKSCTKKTHKQTMWGVKIFKGTSIH